MKTAADEISMEFDDIELHGHENANRKEALADEEEAFWKSD